MTHRPNVLLTVLLTLAACDAESPELSGEDALLGSTFDFAAPLVRQLAVAGATQLPDGRVVVDSRDLVVTAVVTDDSGVTSMCASLDSKSCVVWQDWDGSALVELTPGEGQKRIYLWFRDAAGNVSRRPHTLTVTLDRFGPDDGEIEVNTGPSSASIDWWGFQDRGVGMDGYIVVQGDGRAPASCDEGLVVYSGAGSSLTLTDLEGGRPLGWRVCGVDQLGRTSYGVVAVVVPTTETDAPIVTAFSTADGETQLSNRAVELHIDAVDANGVAAMCISEGPTCSEWTGFDPDARFLLSDEDGQHTLRLWLEDGIGNRSPAPELLDLNLDRLIDRDLDGSPAGVDCDDEDPQKRPGADELCNGIDDNCDGLIDDADPSLMIGAGLRAYRDQDLDGFGDAAQPVEVCALRPGFVSAIGDCDDGAPGIFPGARDACDGEDNNCDGDVDEVRSLFDGDSSAFGPTRQVATGLQLDGSEELAGVVFTFATLEAESTMRFEITHDGAGIIGLGWSHADYADPIALLSGGGKGLRALIDATGVVSEGDDDSSSGDFAAPISGEVSQTF